MSEKIDNFFGAYRFLSNFYPSRIDFEGEVYPTVEHAYASAKTLSPDERYEIRNAPTPGKAKRAGRVITLRSDWESVKIDYMYQFCKQKFQDPYLRQRLLDTGTAELIEGNTWKDTFWGVCGGVGENNLGKLLMKIRQEIRDEMEKEA